MRAKVLQVLMVHALNAMKRKSLNSMLESDDNTSQESILAVEEGIYRSALKKLVSKRYTHRARYRVYSKSERFDFEGTISGENSAYNSDEFLALFRVTRPGFECILNHIKNTNVFKSDEARGRKMRPVSHQLLVFLYRIGRSGADGGPIPVSRFFKIGQGTVSLYVDRVSSALNSYENLHTMWPSCEEREAIKRRVKIMYGFQNCVGILDGTLFILDKRPSVYGDVYYCRKSCYAINCIIICDDRRRIRYYCAGWPGSVHDNRVWRNCRVFKDAFKYFSKREYVTGDSTFSKLAIMVRSFKDFSFTDSLFEQKQFFNTLEVYEHKN